MLFWFKPAIEGAVNPTIVGALPRTWRSTRRGSTASCSPSPERQSPGGPSGTCGDRLARAVGLESGTGMVLVLVGLQ